VTTAWGEGSALKTIPVHGEAGRKEPVKIAVKA